MKESIIEANNLRNAWNAVRTKESAGGIDGTSVEEYGRNIGMNLKKLHCALAEGRWTPKPYVVNGAICIIFENLYFIEYR